MTVQQYKSEITKIQDKLREKEDYLRRMNDYDLLKHENMRMRDEGRHVREQLSKEKLQLQQRNFGKFETFIAEINTYFDFATITFRIGSSMSRTCCSNGGMAPERGKSVQKGADASKNGLRESENGMESERDALSEAVGGGGNSFIRLLYH